MFKFIVAVCWILIVLAVLLLDKTNEDFRSMFLKRETDLSQKRSRGHDKLIDDDNLYEHGQLTRPQIHFKRKHE